MTNEFLTIKRKLEENSISQQERYQLLVQLAKEKGTLREFYAFYGAFKALEREMNEADAVYRLAIGSEAEYDAKAALEQSRWNFRLFCEELPESLCYHLW